MERPTPAQVQALLSVTFPEETVQTAIEDAELMLSPCGNAYDGPRQKAIIKYLAAHLLSSSQQGATGSLKSESVDGTSYSYNGATLSTGLKGTTFGQQALLFDANGCLDNEDGKTEVVMRLL